MGIQKMWTFIEVRGHSPTKKRETSSRFMGGLVGGGSSKKMWTLIEVRGHSHTGPGSSIQRKCRISSRSGVIHAKKNVEFHPGPAVIQKMLNFIKVPGSSKKW